MCLSKRISLTRNRQLGALCWALILAAGLCARFFPVRGLPFPVRIAVAVLLGAAGVVVVCTTLGLFTEKGDERSAENERRTNAALFTLFFLAMGAGLFLLKDGRTVLIGKGELLVIFSSVCLAKDLLFLAYERWSG